MKNFHQFVKEFDTQFETVRREINQSIKNAEEIVSTSTFSDDRINHTIKQIAGWQIQNDKNYWTIMDKMLEAFHYIDKHIQMVNNSIHLPKDTD